ncbi:hypothetical protein CDAR_285961 [Caerostris darwini]|uniref:Uncharacterized protein n=1 Tax=Caerostris darwini TaxID=1538125 RepID=A0AAV4VZ50_9ARAC|nr:hypothetical protein CDAR_285961 [Caerostris darwini]
MAFSERCKFKCNINSSRLRAYIIKGGSLEKLYVSFAYCMYPPCCILSNACTHCASSQTSWSTDETPARRLEIEGSRSIAQLKGLYQNKNPTSLDSLLYGGTLCCLSVVEIMTVMNAVRFDCSLKFSGTVSRTSLPLFSSNA